MTRGSPRGLGLLAGARRRAPDCEGSGTDEARHRRRGLVSLRRDCSSPRVSRPDTTFCAPARNRRRPPRAPTRSSPRLLVLLKLLAASPARRARRAYAHYSSQARRGVRAVRRRGCVGACAIGIESSACRVRLERSGACRRDRGAARGSRPNRSARQAGACEGFPARPHLVFAERAARRSSPRSSRPLAQFEPDPARRFEPFVTRVAWAGGVDAPREGSRPDAACDKAGRRAAHRPSCVLLLPRLMRGKQAASRGPSSPQVPVSVYFRNFRSDLHPRVSACVGRVRDAFWPILSSRPSYSKGCILSERCETIQTCGMRFEHCSSSS